MLHSSFITVADIKKRMAELEAIAPHAPTDDDEAKWTAWEELDNLRDIRDQIEWCWDEDNATLINEDHFEMYCEETCYELGDVQRDGVVAGCVDWAKVANTMRQDYRVIDVEGDAYLIRN